MPKVTLKDYDGEYELALFITVDRSHGGFTPKVYPVKRYTQDRRIRGISDYDATQLYLDNLYLSAFGYAPSYAGRQVTGFEVQYHEVYRVDRSKARRMSKTLDVIAKKFEAMRNKLGPPTTFGQECARFGLAIAARIMLQQRDTNTSSSFDDHTYWTLTLGDGASAIDHLCNEWVAEGTKEVEA